MNISQFEDQHFCKRTHSRFVPKSDLEPGEPANDSVFCFRSKKLGYNRGFLGGLIWLGFLGFSGWRVVDRGPEEIDLERMWVNPELAIISFITVVAVGLCLFSRIWFSNSPKFAPWGLVLVPTSVMRLGITGAFATGSLWLQGYVSGLSVWSLIWLRLFLPR